MTWQRGREIVAGVLAAVVVGYVGFVLVAAVVSARADRQTAAAAVATVREDLTKINRLDTQIRKLSAAGKRASRQRAHLETEVSALTSQLRQLGVIPVVTGRRPTVAPTPQTMPSASPGPPSRHGSSTRPSRPAGPTRSPRPSSTRPTKPGTPMPTASPVRSCLQHPLHCHLPL